MKTVILTFSGWFAAAVIAGAAMVRAHETGRLPAVHGEMQPSAHGASSSEQSGAVDAEAYAAEPAPLSETGDSGANVQAFEESGGEWGFPRDARDFLAKR